MQQRSSLISRYDEITQRYKAIVKGLTEGDPVGWKGSGAEAFKEDSAKVIANLSGIKDILTTMCDTLSDCLEIYQECDSELKKNNETVVQESEH